MVTQSKIDFSSNICGVLGILVIISLTTQIAFGALCCKKIQTKRAKRKPLL